MLTQRGLRCVCVCLSQQANLQTGARRRVTEGTSGLSGIFFTKVKRCFLQNSFVRKLEALQAYPGPSQLESAILFTLQCFVYSPFHVRTASAIMVPRKRMRVRGYSICTRVCAQLPQHALRTQYSTLPCIITTS